MKNQTPQNLKEVPGRYGCKIIGFVQFGLDWYGFFAKRQKKYNSSVFKASPGIKCINITDQQGIDPVFDISLVDKMYGFGPLIPPLPWVGNVVPNVYNNGEEHVNQKQFVMNMVRARGRDGFTEFNQVLTPYIRQWEKDGVKPDFNWGDGINRFWSDFIFKWLLGASPKFEDVDLWGVNVLAPLGLKLPWLNGKMLKALERILAAIKSGSKFQEAADMASEAAGLTPDETAKQICFILGFNSYGGLAGLTKSVIAELTLAPDWQSKVIEEIKTVLAGGEEPGKVTMKKVAQMKTLQAVIKETLRLHPPAPVAFGKARKDFVIHSSSGDFPIKKGEVLNGLLGHASRDPLVFKNPNTFDPSRFDDPQMDRYVIWANGRDVNEPGVKDHMCGGRDFVYLFIQLFCIYVLPDYQWKFKQSMAWSDGALVRGNEPETPLEGTFSRR